VIARAGTDAASVLLTNTLSVWETASAPKKRRLQPLLFPEGITLDGKSDWAEIEELVDQLRGSWNSLLAWLRDVQAWSLAAEVGE